jgi:hypothetical protein
MAKQNEPKWLKPNTPTRRIARPDGTVKMMKVSPIPFREKMVDLDGNTIDVSLATGYGIRGFQNNMYGIQKRAEKIARGFLPYSECPVNSGYPGADAVKGKRCDGKDGRGKMERDTCCEHIEQIAAARRKAAQKREARLRERFATLPERQIEIMMRQYTKDSADEVPATRGKSRMPG